MKKLIIVFFCLNFFNLYALNLPKNDVVYLFQNSKFHLLCQNRWKYINKYLGKREDLLSLVAFSCLKEHKITLALDLAKALRFTKIGRNNANYIATLFNIKTLLIRYIKDDFSLNDINIPYVLDDDLGRVFYFVKKQKPLVRNGFFEVKDKNRLFKVYYDVKSNRFILKIYKHAELIKKEIYW